MWTKESYENFDKRCKENDIKVFDLVQELAIRKRA